MQFEFPQLAQTLAQYSGQNVFFDPLFGNNGDQLIQLGSLSLLQDHNLIPTKNLDESEVVVINGGGGLGVELYFPNLYLLRRKLKLYKDKDLVILPSSYYFRSIDFHKIFQHRQRRTYIFAREQYSFARLKKYEYGPRVFIDIEHDTALKLFDFPLIKDLKEIEKSEQILFVQRQDVENSKLIVNYPVLSPILWVYRKIVPAAIKNHLARKQIDKNDYIKLHLLNYYPEFTNCDFLFRDISSDQLYSFDDFCKTIASANTVISSRLHAGVLAALLGINTIFLTRKWDHYNKVKGIYEYSLAEFENTQLITI